MDKKSTKIDTVAVTGATGGIGGALVEALLRDGVPVLASGRDVYRLAELEASGAQVVQADIGTQQGCDVVASAAQGAGVRCFVHCAGVWPSQRELTEDGWELAFAVNHLAPFRINSLLADRPQASGESLRVVQVGAGLAIRGKVDFQKTPTGLDFGPIRTYINTKLWNALATLEWSKRWPDVDICSIHPGVISTELGARKGVLGLMLRLAKKRWQDPADSIDGIRYLLDCEPAQREIFVNTDGREPVDIPHRELQSQVFDSTVAMIRP